MERKYEVMDVVVALGAFATIVAGGMLFLAANGTMSLSQPAEQTEETAGSGDGMRWLQPALGRAMVDQFVLERRHATQGETSRHQLTAVTGEQGRRHLAPFGYLDSLKRYAARAEDDHKTRVQTVMGRMIVNFTRRGLHGDVLSPDGGSTGFNTRMRTQTEALGRRMDAEFLLNWQPNLGRAIVTASQDDMSASARRQERLGAAIVQVSTVDIAYEASRAELQEQLGGATMITAHAGSQTGLSGSERPVQPLIVAARPGLPISTMVAAAVTLMTLFAAGLMVPPVRPATGAA